MKLIPNWRRIAARAWSMYGMYALVALTIAEAVLPVLEIPAPLYTALVGVIAALTALARLIDQEVDEFLNGEGAE